MCTTFSPFLYLLLLSHCPCCLTYDDLAMSVPHLPYIFWCLSNVGWSWTSAGLSKFYSTFAEVNHFVHVVFACSSLRLESQFYT